MLNKAIHGILSEIIFIEEKHVYGNNDGIFLRLCKDIFKNPIKKVIQNLIWG